MRKDTLSDQGIQAVRAPYEKSGAYSPILFNSHRGPRGSPHAGGGLEEFWMRKYVGEIIENMKIRCPLAAAPMAGIEAFFQGGN